MITGLFGLIPEPPKTEKKGYAAPPGTGPAGETCGTCGHIYAHDYNSRTYFKCMMGKGGYTSGSGSDIRKKSPACMFWTKKP